ncbi:hypothetical protein AVEN_18746-1 [Araneus ventricosus]|uniref:Uncharacterized protein n=1 Tax=Araneus ventricosus TaxID=182803 RepID=A0A4Y2G7Y1_ARAVE|nr:hypothetical protein AVEN_18746-1 [Araneus ventricosus]
MAGKRFLQRFSLEVKAMSPGRDDKLKLLENARIMILSILGTEIWRTFERILCDVMPCRKSYIYTKDLKRVNQSFFGVLSKVQAGEMKDTECY